MIKLLDLLKEMADTVKCKNCGWEWKLSDGGKDPYVCHKCQYNNKTNKFVDSLKEMGLNDWGVQNIIDAYKRNPNKAKEISITFAGQTEAPLDAILNIISGMDKADFDEKLKSVGLHNLEEACWDGYQQQGMKKKGDKMVPNCVRVSENVVNKFKKWAGNMDIRPTDIDYYAKEYNLTPDQKYLLKKAFPSDDIRIKSTGPAPDIRFRSSADNTNEAKKKKKINPAYLTKDAAAMRKEIERVKKLKSDDPSAYNKWDADYADKAKTKKYKTKKSAATSAYEKRFGKKEK